MKEPKPLEMKATAFVTIEGPEYTVTNEWDGKPQTRRYKLYDVRFEGPPADLVNFLAEVVAKVNSDMEEKEETG